MPQCESLSQWNTRCIESHPTTITHYDGCETWSDDAMKAGDGGVKPGPTTRCQSCNHTEIYHRRGACSMLKDFGADIECGCGVFVPAEAMKAGDGEWSKEQALPPFNNGGFVLVTAEGKWIMPEPVIDAILAHRAAAQQADELNVLFDMQHKRTMEAFQRWRKSGKLAALAQPDFGKMLDWLFEEAQQAVRLRTALGHYGQHIFGCPSYRLGGERCTCGLAAALKATAGKP